MAHGLIITSHYNPKCEILKQNTLNTNIDIYLTFKDIKKLHPELKSTLINPKISSNLRKGGGYSAEKYSITTMMISYANLLTESGRLIIYIYKF